MGPTQLAMYTDNNKMQSAWATVQGANFGMIRVNPDDMIIGFSDGVGDNLSAERRKFV